MTSAVVLHGAGMSLRPTVAMRAGRAPRAGKAGGTPRTGGAARAGPGVRAGAPGQAGSAHQAEGPPQPGTGLRARVPDLAGPERRRDLGVATWLSTFLRPARPSILLWHPERSAMESAASWLRLDAVGVCC